MKKRIVSLMMAAVLALSLAACGGAGAAKPAEEAQEEAAEEQAEEAVEQAEEAEEAAEEKEEQAQEAAETGDSEDESDPIPENDTIEQLAAEIAALEVGTAGSSLKAADLAARFIALFANGEADPEKIQEVLAAMSPEDQEKFTDNFVELIWPVVEGALDASDTYGGLLDDLGLSKALDEAMSESFSPEDLETLKLFVEALKEDEAE